MQCYRCGGGAIERRTTYNLSTDKGLVLVREVPAYVCDRCGEQTFSLDVVRNLERLRDEIERDRRTPTAAKNVSELAYTA